ncbi:MAG: hypothetical protein NVS3B26_02090 [Mycobacteriales bacterium]
MVLVLAVVVLLVGSIGYGAVLNGQIGRIHVGGLAGEASGRSTGTENILLVGSTSRCALKRQNPAFGLCSQGVNGVNSDVIMVLHLNYAKRSLSLLSIPRDTFVPNARQEGANKIDAALAEGPTQLVRAVQSDFGIPIQHYISLNFDTFAGVVDALGGIRMYFPAAVYDAYSGLNVPAPGCRTLDGFHALQVVRARHLQHRTATANPTDPASWPGEDESDLARIRRNHEFLRVLASAVARQGLGNPITDTRLVRAVAPKLQVDSGMSAAHLISLIRTFHSVNINGSPQLTLPIVNTTFGSYRYKGGNYGDIVWPSQPQDLDVVRQVLDLSADRDTSGGRLPAPADVTVSVLNGTGLPHAGATAGRLLTRLGYRVVHIGDTPSVGTRSESVVYYGGPADLGAAEGVLERLTGHAVLGIEPRLATAGARVTVVTGTDFTILAEAPVGSPTPPAPAAAVAPAGQSAAVATGNAPTAPVEALAPYDPRSCTPTTGPGN